MATVTVNRAAWFPVGTSVSFYPRGAGAQRLGPPSGAAVGSATVAADGSLALPLPDDRPYVAYANVGGEHRYLSVRDSSFVPGTTWKAKVAARRAAIGTS
jgi:hypothetical protein